MQSPEEGRISSRIRLLVYCVCFVIGALAYLRIVPVAAGILAAAAVPLVWAVEAYRRQSRLAFLFAALLLFLALAPLLVSRS